MYKPLVSWLTEQGFCSRSEVNHCDVIATRGDELIIIELKCRFGIELLAQAVKRQEMCDSVYVAVPRPEKKNHNDVWKRNRRLLRRLELGLLFINVTPPLVEVVSHPIPWVKKRNLKGRRAVLKEISGRSGDYNVGGCTRKKIVTAYREMAIQIAVCLNARGTLSPKALRMMGCSDKSRDILARDVYGWFDHVGRALYAIRPAGKCALLEYGELTQFFLSRINDDERSVDG